MNDDIMKLILDCIKIDCLDRFYWSKEWRKLRKEAIKRDKGECQHCKAKGIYTKGTEIHHIKEVKDHPGLALELANLLTLCKECHNKVHDKGHNMNTLSNVTTFFNEERW